MKWKWYIYILQCQDNSYYTGCTWDSSNRLEQHLLKLGGEYTRNHGVKKLVYQEEFEDLTQARQREIQIKSWSRVKKEKLIKGEWNKEW
ncbi:MAG: GIY-YIG nuclease family protein [Patescibacteria group bacterium]